MIEATTVTHRHWIQQTSNAPSATAAFQSAAERRSAVITATASVDETILSAPRRTSLWCSSMMMTWRREERRTMEN